MTDRDEDFRGIPRVLGSNLERDKALAKLDKQLERMEPAPPVTKQDFWAMIPSKDQLRGPDLDVLRAELELEREARLEASGILTAITEEDRDWLIRDALPLETDALYNVKGWDHKRSSLSYAFSVCVLVGLTGRGKTVSAGWLLAKYSPGLYCTAEELRASFDSFAAKDRALFRKALQTRVLVIDELGREKDAVTADAMLFEIVNARRGRPNAHLTRKGHHQLWTLMLGNIDEQVFRARYDAVTVSKIEQLGAIFTVEGENLRGRVIDKLMRGET